jgi:glycosyltransferase involved in cell wall biosynthesis
MILPGAGGYRVAEMRSLIQEPDIKKRRLIMVKGYEGWAGRASHALQAIESCADFLKQYEIVVYLASPSIVEKVAAMQKTTHLNIRVLPRSPHHLILELFGQARIAIGINQTDGVPNAMLEAMTMGAFPIQSDTESTAEWLTNGENGLLVDYQNPEAIATAIQKAVTDDALVENAARANAELIFNRLDLSIVQPRVMEMYQAIASGHGVVSR